MNPSPTSQAKDEVRAINRDMARIARRAAAEPGRGSATLVERSARPAPPRRPGPAPSSTGSNIAERVVQIAAQTRQRIAGATPDGATRLVSLHDPAARPIAKGRLGKPVEFGYKAQVVDNETAGIPPKRGGIPFEEW
jgi:IS5 family transposase